MHLSAVSTLREVVTLPGETGDAIEMPGTTGYDALLAAGSDEPLAFTVTDENAPISLNYTSGTTGDPKGVVYTHRGAYLTPATHGFGSERAGQRDPPGVR